jgi:hypothetical protein
LPEDALALSPAEIPADQASPPPVIDLPEAAPEPLAPPPTRRLGPLPTFTPPRRVEPQVPPTPEPLREPDPKPEPPRSPSQDPFASLEEEMASLLGRIPGGSKP